MWNKLYLYVVALFILFLSFSVYADEKTGGYKADFIEMEWVGTSGEVSLFSDTTASFEEFLYDALYNRKLDAKAQDSSGNMFKALDVSEYEIPIEEAIDVFENIALKNPELMMDTSRYGGTSNAGNARLLVPYYLFDDIDESRAEYAKMEKWIDAFVTSVDKNLSDEEKLLKAYYFVADNVEYSYGEMLENQDPLIFTAYNAFNAGHCVCQGYTTLMCCILEKFGVECGVVPTVEALQYEAPHIWNYVVLDGKNYHLDITWDDLDYSDAKVGYADFLISDETRRANMINTNAVYENYVDIWKFFDGDKVCDSDKYEDGYIWNWLGAATDIVSCSRGYKLSCVMPVIENESLKYDKANYVFAGIKIPDDMFITSEITVNNRLFYIFNVPGEVKTRLYIAKYDEQNRMTGLITSNVAFFRNVYGWDWLDVSKPNAHKTNIMWLDSKTLVPLGRNVVME